MFLLLLLLQLVFGGFHDTTCQKLRCTKSEMKIVNHAKMLGLGNHSCITTYIKYNLNQTVQLSFTYLAIVNSYYEPSTGSLHSDFIVPGSPTVQIDEYCDGKGNVCIDILGASNGGYYTESIDQNKGPVGTTYRSIGYYTPDSKKTLVGIQWFVPSRDGDMLSLTWFDNNGGFDYSVNQKCTKIASAD